LAAFDFDSALRWARFAPDGTLARRSHADLSFVQEASAGRALLLDTCVYLDRLQGRAPNAVSDLLGRRVVNHSTVALQEMMHSVGVLDPQHRGTAAAVHSIGEIVRAMPTHRTFAPDPDVLGRAALLSGILCRLQGYSGDGRLRALHDCTIFLQAQKLGLVVLTANIADFDILTQLIPAGTALFYRRT
jgi:hypothetical protein